ncbi:MAG: hypothetical protein AAGG00_09875 [Cyanobacteria bacterium P01_H01_bin.150]
MKLYFGSARAIVPQCTLKTLASAKTSDNLVYPYIEELVESNQCPQKRNRVNIEAIENGNYPLKSNFLITIMVCHPS